MQGLYYRKTATGSSFQYTPVEEDLERDLERDDAMSSLPPEQHRHAQRSTTGNPAGPGRLRSALKSSGGRIAEPELDVIEEEPSLEHLEHDRDVHEDDL